MTPAVDKMEVDGEWHYSCKMCGTVLIRIEPKGILGNGLNDLDALVISDHYFTYHK